MPYIHGTGRLLYRLRRRIAATLLVTMLTGIIGLVCFVAWVVRTTMPVVVVDQNGRPVSGALIFDLSKALGARGRPARHRNSWYGIGGPGTPLFPFWPASANPMSQSTGA